jgi:hypothetical protein
VNFLILLLIARHSILRVEGRNHSPFEEVDEANFDDEMSNPIEPIDWAEINDFDSGYNEEQMSTASITSSIFAYQQENGRTYHAYKAGKYVMPNDEGEQERMDRKLASAFHGTQDLHISSPLPCTPPDLRQQALDRSYRRPTLHNRRRDRNRNMGHGRG